MRKHEPFEDDGRTIADMSGIEHSPMWLPRRKEHTERVPQEPAAPERPWEQNNELTRKERFWVVMGALKATLMISAVYLIALVALVLFLLWLWC